MAKSLSRKREESVVDDRNVEQVSSTSTVKVTRSGEV